MLLYFTKENGSSTVQAYNGFKEMLAALDTFADYYSGCSKFTIVAGGCYIRNPASAMQSFLQSDFNSTEVGSDISDIFFTGFDEIKNIALQYESSFMGERGYAVSDVFTPSSAFREIIFDITKSSNKNISITELEELADSTLLYLNPDAYFTQDPESIIKYIQEALGEYIADFDDADEDEKE